MNSQATFEGYEDLLIYPPTESECLREFPELFAETEILASKPARCLYVLSRHKGNDHKWAAMFALRQAPRVMTDDVFLGGVGTLDQQIRNPIHLAALVRAAESQGYRPSPWDFYNPSIAKRLGDPAAFLKHGDGRSKARRVLEGRGYRVGRELDVEACEPETDPWEKPVHKLNPRIAKRLLKQAEAADPAIKFASDKKRKEVLEHIVEKHGSKAKV